MLLEDLKVSASRFEELRALAATIGAKVELADKWVVSNLPVTLDKTCLSNLGAYTFARCDTLGEVQMVLDAVMETM